MRCMMITSPGSPSDVRWPGVITAHRQCPGVSHVTVLPGLECDPICHHDHHDPDQESDTSVHWHIARHIVIICVGHPVLMSLYLITVIIMSSVLAIVRCSLCLISIQYLPTMANVCRAELQMCVVQSNYWTPSFRVHFPFCLSLGHKC